MAHPPKSLQPILWSVDVNQLDIQKDKWYIIHQILIYGTLEELRWLFRTYSKQFVQDFFIKHPAKLYPKEVFHFVKHYLLDLGEKRLDQDDYVTSISGPIRQRAAKRIS